MTLLLGTRANAHLGTTGNDGITYIVTIDIGTSLIGSRFPERSEGKGQRHMPEKNKYTHLLMLELHWALHRIQGQL